VQYRQNQWTFPAYRLPRRAFFLMLFAALMVIPITMTAVRPVQAQLGGGPAESPILTVREAKLTPLTVIPGGKATLTLTLAMRPGFHINANKPDSDMQIPTELELPAPAKKTGIVLGKPVFPAAKSLKVTYSEKPLKVYEDTITVTVPIAVSKTAPLGKVPLKGKINYQGCNEAACFPPASADFAASLTVKK
jgi:hypothetical protein